MTNVPNAIAFPRIFSLVSVATDNAVEEREARLERARRDAERALLASIRRGNTWQQPVDLDEVVRRDATISSQYAGPDRSVTVLLAHAQWVLSGLVRGAETKPTPLAEAAISRALRLFVRSGGPTPQVGLSDDGLLDVEWIVGDRTVALDVADDGLCSIYGEGPDAEDEFEFEFRDPADMDADHLQAARSVLARMGQAVKSPVGA
jgi:hypothetical protein